MNKLGIQNLQFRYNQTGLLCLGNNVYLVLINMVRPQSCVHVNNSLM